MGEEKCSSCQYFMQHYCLGGGKLFRVCCGHCSFSWVKRKCPDAKACENFIPGPAGTDAFATREYLSKELVQRVLNMPLLPEIEDLPAPSKGKRRG